MANPVLLGGPFDGYVGVNGDPEVEAIYVDWSKDLNAIVYSVEPEHPYKYNREDEARYIYADLLEPIDTREIETVA